MGSIRMNQPAYERYCAIENERKQERKEQARKERLKYIRDGFFAIIIGIIVGVLTGCRNTDEQAFVNSIKTTQSVNNISVMPVNANNTESNGIDKTAYSDNQYVSLPEHEEIHEMPNATGSWHDANQSHDITVNTVIQYESNAIFNFNDTVAVGVYGENGLITTAESESGFILSVIDNDSVHVSFYNYGTDYIVPVKLTAEMSTTDYENETGATEYIITGYNDCTDGFGVVEMTLSNELIVRAGVFREEGQLYAANFTTNPVIAENASDFRLKMEPILAEGNIRPDNSTYTDPIYYPMVPVSDNEKTDVDFWVNKSNELIEEDWTDAHKVVVLYNYIIDNLAYDRWVVSQGKNSRTFYYNDFTGTYFTSKTNVGVCEDFSNILAIMCRAQNIPATKINTGTHAWNYVYIADYNRWLCIDVTSDLKYNCYSEDVSNWTNANNKRYANYDNVTNSKLSAECFACIGNYVDMERYGKIPVELQ